MNQAQRDQLKQHFVNDLAYAAAKALVQVDEKNRDDLLEELQDMTSLFQPLTFDLTMAFVKAMDAGWL